MLWCPSLRLLVVFLSYDMFSSCSMDSVFFILSVWLSFPPSILVYRSSWKEGFRYSFRLALQLFPLLPFLLSIVPCWRLSGRWKVVFPNVAHLLSSPLCLKLAFKLDWSVVWGPLFGLPFAVAPDSLPCSLVALMSFFVPSLSLYKGRVRFHGEIGLLVLRTIQIILNFFYV